MTATDLRALAERAAALLGGTCEDDPNENFLCCIETETARGPISIWKVSQGLTEEFECVGALADALPDGIHLHTLTLPFHATETTLDTRGAGVSLFSLRDGRTYSEHGRTPTEAMLSAVCAALGGA